MSAHTGRLDPDSGDLPTNTATSGAASEPFEAARSIPELLASAARIAARQVEIWLKEAGGGLIRFALMSALLAGGAVCCALSLVYLLISFFHMLTDLLHIAPAWAFLIFAGVHMGAAIVCVGSTRFIRARRQTSVTPPAGSEP